MTLDDFVNALAACAPWYRWVVEDGSGYLRGSVDDPTGGRVEYCPLTALVCAHSGGLWEVTDWEDAAQTVGLTLDDASRVVGAADDERSDEERALRTRLLKAVGL